MHAVGDHFRGQLVEKEDSFQNAAAHRVGLSLAEPRSVRHGAKQVVDVANSPRDGGLHLVKGSVTVAGVATDAPRSTSVNESFGASHFRSYRGSHNTVG